MVAAPHDRVREHGPRSDHAKPSTVEAQDVPDRATESRLQVRAHRLPCNAGSNRATYVLTMHGSSPPYVLLLAFALPAAACAHTSPPALRTSPGKATVEPSSTAAPPAARCDPPKLTPAQYIAQHGTALDRYQIEGGVWLPHAPVLVNRDFDFALAMGMEGGIGAGLAAAKRKKENEARAAELAEVVLSKEAEAKLEELRCRGTHVYFVLWDEAEPVLRAVVDDGVRPGRLVNTALSLPTDVALVRQMTAFAASSHFAD